MDNRVYPSCVGPQCRPVNGDRRGINGRYCASCRWLWLAWVASAFGLHRDFEEVCMYEDGRNIVCLT